MTNGKKGSKRKAEALVAAIEQILEDFAEPSEKNLTPEEIDPMERVHKLAAKAAQQHRLAGKKVPAHVRAAFNATKAEVAIEDAEPGKLQSIIESLTQPMLGRTKRVSHAYRERKGKLSKKDEELVQGLSEELKEDWTEEDGNDSS